ncbi:XRE family transcriptional regulator [Roseovarius faecimaris]|uniref:XRE family transcriptional regulator n=1 Tax=Roseovarius faecimaris TaxID=2494550 RepID=A0A6I6ITR8_9RHOB|nr:helix-turn-helix transcriptional regulator [Roseovarius faecimaris]QGX99484.1 XRE family transcriptional regulator [Roseovarius faecimaris]
MSDTFPKNLRSLCAEYGSIAEVCRGVGINRQQFSRYLSGAGMPSAHNLRRIARYFSISEADLFANHQDFTQRHILNQKRAAHGPVDLMIGPFRDQAKLLRRYLGFYHGHFQTPSWDNMVLRSLVWLYEKDGFVMTRSLERVTAADGSIRQKSRYEGMAMQSGNRIYVIEQELAREGSVVETILTPSHRQQVKYLRGLTMGVAWRPHVMPYSSRAIWKRIEDRVAARDALLACGAFPLESRDIDPTIRSFLRDDPATDSPASPRNILV